MGKIRVKTLGDEGQEQQDKKQRKVERDQKKLTRAPGQKGGQRVVTVGPSEEEIEQLDKKTATTETQKPAEAQKLSVSEKSSDSVVAIEASVKDKKPKKAKAAKARQRSRRYQEIVTLVDKTKVYPIPEALSLLPQLAKSKFDETVELHINTIEIGVNGDVTLPNGTGKKTRVGVASDELIAEVEKGKINFDVLLAEPSMMPKLAKVAKVLGPRGLMPNPKNGTITSNPKEAAKEYEGGKMNFKTEAKAPVIHLTIGKVSFGDKKLMENVKTILSAIPATKIRNITLKSTMSPGIKINFAQI